MFSRSLLPLCKYVHMEGRKDFSKLFWTSDWQKIMFSGKHTSISSLLLIQTGAFGWKPPDGFESHQIRTTLQIWCSIKHKINLAVIQQQYSGAGFSCFPFPFSLPLVSRRITAAERERVMQASRPESFAAHFQMLISFNQSKLRECK